MSVVPASQDKTRTGTIDITRPKPPLDLLCEITTQPKFHGNQSSSGLECLAGPALTGYIFAFDQTLAWSKQLSVCGLGCCGLNSNQNNFCQPH